MNIQPRFKEGDTVTYKYIKDLPKAKYCYGGKCCGGQIGAVQYISHFVEDQNCYRIYVTNDWGKYAMLENEFIEYDKPQKPLNGYFFDMVVKRRRRLESLGIKPRQIKKYH